MHIQGGEGFIYCSENEQPFRLSTQTVLLPLSHRYGWQRRCFKSFEQQKGPVADNQLGLLATVLFNFPSEVNGRSVSIGCQAGERNTRT